MRILFILMLFFFISCDKEENITTIKYIEFESMVVHFPEQYDSTINIGIDIENDNVYDFEIETFYNEVYDLYITDSVVAYQKVASIYSLNNYLIPFISCHISPGAPVIIDKGEIIDESIMDCFPPDNKCSCMWGEHCYLFKIFDGGIVITPNYLPIKLIANNESYFGWIEMEVGDSIILKGFAVSLTADNKIRAGQVN